VVEEVRPGKQQVQEAIRRREEKLLEAARRLAEV